MGNQKAHHGCTSCPEGSANRLVQTKDDDVPVRPFRSRASGRGCVQRLWREGHVHASMSSIDQMCSNRPISKSLIGKNLVDLESAASYIPAVLPTCLFWLCCKNTQLTHPLAKTNCSFEKFLDQSCNVTSFWFQPIWKICSSKWESSLKFGVKIKNIWVATTWCIGKYTLCPMDPLETSVFRHIV